MKYIMKILLLLILCTAINYASELMEESKISKTAKQLFLNANFNRLTLNASNYLKNKDKTLNGKWKLRFVYKGIFNAFNINIKDAEYWDNLEKKLLKWTKNYPNEPISYISYASYLYHKAWMHRGQDSAKNVSKRAFQLFDEERNKSKQYLLKYKNIASNDPQWYVLMLSIARGEGLSEKDFLNLFDEALTKYPNYDALYEFAIFYMKPNWNNFSKEKIEQYAQRVLDLSKDKDGAYAKFYMYVKSNIYKDTLFYQSDVNWTILKNSFNKLTKNYPTQDNLNQFAYLSCLKNDKDTTRELINNQIVKPVMSIWKSYDNYNRCKKLSDNKENNNSYKIKTITPHELTNYIQNTTKDKPQLFYFSSYAKNCRMCDINNFKKLAQKYDGKVEFISVNLYPEKSIFKYSNVYIPYYITSTPSMMLVYKKKIIRRMYYIDLVKKYNQYIMKIDETLKELNGAGFLAMFKETISDKASYLNSDDHIRFLDPLFLNSKGYKARACSVSLNKNRIACEQNFSFESQETVNQLVLEMCEKKKERLGLKDECRLHRLGKEYVYENNIISKQKKQRSVGFTNVSFNKIKQYISTSSSTKPQYIYFKRENKNISNPIINLSKEFNSTVDFLSVDINGTNNDLYDNLKIYFGLKTLPCSVVVYKNKIVLINDESHTDNFWLESMKWNLNYLLKNLNNKKYLNLFGEGINKNYYFAYNAKIRTHYNKKRYLRFKNSKAWFVAIGNSYSVHGWESDCNNTYELLYKAYIKCKINSVGYNIPNDCNLYMLDNDYVYNNLVNSEVIKIQKEIESELKLVKSISINEIDDYIKRVSNKKPLFVYFGGDKNTREVLELMAKSYKNKIEFVWLNLDLTKNDLLHQKIKKKFNISYNRHTVIIFKENIVFSEGGRLDGNGNYGREKINKKLLKLLLKIKHKNFRG